MHINVSVCVYNYQFHCTKAIYLDELLIEHSNAYAYVVNETVPNTDIA